MDIEIWSLSDVKVQCIEGAIHKCHKLLADIRPHLQLANEQTAWKAYWQWHYVEFNLGDHIWLFTTNLPPELPYKLAVPWISPMEFL